MLVAGKRIIVTGGLTGIGRGSALKMVQEGARVITMSRQSSDSQAAREMVKAGAVAHIRCDVTDQQQVDRAFDEAAGILGGLDVMLNSAGMERTKPTESLTAQDFLETLTLNVIGTAFTNVAAFRHMKPQGSGSIINISSVAGVHGWPSMADYSASKAAVLAYTRVVAREWGPFGIRVNAIAPAAKSDMYVTWMAAMSSSPCAAISARWKTPPM